MKRATPRHRDHNPRMSEGNRMYAESYRVLRLRSWSFITLLVPNLSSPPLATPLHPHPPLNGDPIYKKTSRELAAFRNEQNTIPSFSRFFFSFPSFFVSFLLFFLLAYLARLPFSFLFPFLFLLSRLPFFHFCVWIRRSLVFAGWASGNASRVASLFLTHSLAHSFTLVQKTRPRQLYR